MKLNSDLQSKNTHEENHKHTRLSGTCVRTWCTQSGDDKDLRSRHVITNVERLSVIFKSALRSCLVISTPPLELALARFSRANWKKKTKTPASNPFRWNRQGSHGPYLDSVFPFNSLLTRFKPNLSTVPNVQGINDAASVFRRFSQLLFCTNRKISFNASLVTFTPSVGVFVKAFACCPQKGFGKPCIH